VGANMITQAIPTHMTLLSQIIFYGFKSNISDCQDDMLYSNWLQNAMDYKSMIFTMAKNFIF
jgi:hypothetical protein